MSENRKIASLTPILHRFQRVPATFRTLNQRTLSSVPVQSKLTLLWAL
jgi:hypothetical protein